MLTAHAKILMRHGISIYEMTPSQEVAASFEGGPFVTCVRVLDGVELMQLMGYPVSQVLSKPWPKHSLATSLAGNAFCAFNLVPFLIGIAAVLEPDCSVKSACKPVRVAGADDGDFVLT